MKYGHEMIMCIVNAGFSGEVMKAARSAGAMGGTVIHARGTASKEAEKLFEIVVTPEKDMVFIVVENEIKDAVLTALYDNVGLDTDAHGMAFSMPISRQIGLKPNKNINKNNDEA